MVSGMRLVRELEVEPWRRFVEGNELGNVFHTPEMFEVFSRAARHEPELWAVVADDEEVVALFTPVRVSLAGPPLRGLTSRAIAYGGVACEPGDRGIRALRRLVRDYNASARHRALFTELRNLEEPNGIRTDLEQMGFAYEEHLNFVVPVEGDLDETFRRVSPSTRKRLRRAHRAGTVTVNEVQDRAELTDWYTVLRKTYRHARVPLADASLFEAAFDVLVPSGMIRFFAARVEGEIVACSAELCFKDTVYGWYGGTDRGFSRYIPNDVLTWHVIEWAHTNGYRKYDFGGAGTPGREYGVRDFKAKFGGALVEPGRFTAVHAPVRFAMSKFAYRVYQHRPVRKARVTESPGGLAR